MSKSKIYRDGDWILYNLGDGARDSKGQVICVFPGDKTKGEQVGGYFVYNEEGFHEEIKPDHVVGPTSPDP